LCQGSAKICVLFSGQTHTTGSKEDRKFEQLVKKIVPHSRLLRTWRLNGGISAEMTALEAEGGHLSLTAQAFGKLAVQ
jgi:hypothetical protein